MIEKCFCTPGTRNRAKQNMSQAWISFHHRALCLCVWLSSALWWNGQHAWLKLRWARVRVPGVPKHFSNIFDRKVGSNLLKGNVTLYITDYLYQLYKNTYKHKYTIRNISSQIVNTNNWIQKNETYFKHVNRNWLQLWGLTIKGNEQIKIT